MRRSWVIGTKCPEFVHYLSLWINMSFAMSTRSDKLILLIVLQELFIGATKYKSVTFSFQALNCGNQTHILTVGLNVVSGRAFKVWNQSHSIGCSISAGFVQKHTNAKLQKTVWACGISLKFLAQCDSDDAFKACRKFALSSYFIESLGHRLR